MKLVLSDDRQRILDTDGHALITGEPGSGKTTIALAKAEKRINAGLETGQSVLFLSFSRAAVARVLEASKLHLSKDLQRQLSIQTFHSFFWEILQAHGYLLGAPKRLRLLLPHDERAMRNGEEGEDATWEAERDRLFREEGLVAFDLFAPKAHALLQRSEKIRRLFSSRHPLIVVDETQDTSEDQWHCVRLLAEQTQLVCLADLDQQIYDFRPGVTAERLTQIMTALNPLRVDLQSENHRSPGLEIVTFGNDILLNTPRGASYKGVSQLYYKPDRANRDKAIRQSVGIVSDHVRRCVGEPPQSIAILATWGRGVTVITKALTGDGVTNRIAHRVMIDEAPVMLSSRLIAFLLEPRGSNDNELMNLADGLELAAAILRSKGGTSSLSQAKGLARQASAARKGQRPRGNTVAHTLLGVLRKLRDHAFGGEPRKDWLEARGQLRDSGAGLWTNIAGYAEQLIAFQRGQHIASALSELWQTQGNYAGARRALDIAVSQDQLLSGGNDLRGIHVMTVHKSKAKEFDAVVIMDDSNNSPLVYCKEREPYPRSRKLFRVGITRAKHHALLLTDLYNPSVLLSRHRLR